MLLRACTANKVWELLCTRAAVDMTQTPVAGSADHHNNLLSGSCCNLEPVLLLHAENLGDGSCILLFSGAEVASGLPTMLHHLRLDDVCLGTTRVMYNRDNAYTNKRGIQSS